MDAISNILFIRIDLTTLTLLDNNFSGNICSEEKPVVALITARQLMITYFILENEYL